MAELPSDDTCGPDEECALSLRQLRGEMKAGESDAQMAEDSEEEAVELAANVTEDEGSACSAGYVGQIRAAAPDCINACQGSCYALEKAIDQYLTKGGQPAVHRYVCQKKGGHFVNLNAFKCFVSGHALPKCKPLIAKAAGFGFKLPQS